MFASTLALCLTLAAPKVALLPIERSDSIDEKTAEALSGVLANELRRAAALELLTYREVAALLTHQANKELLSCNQESCYVELGQALGADQIITANVTKVGESLIFGARRIDVKKLAVLADVSKRVKKIDDLLDVMPEVAKGLATNLPPPSAAAPPAAPAAAPPMTSEASAGLPQGDAKLPQPWNEQPLANQAELKKGLTVATDGQGRYVAFTAGTGVSQPLYVGTADKLHKSVSIGGSSEGTKKFDFTLWDPRLKHYASFSGNEGALKIECDDKSFELRTLSTKESAAVLKKAQLLAPRWRRQGFALARDDDGNYFYVDKGRYEPELDDYRLFAGTRGAMTHLPLKDAVVDPSGWLFITSQGKLLFDASGVAWVQGGVRKPLNFLEISENGRFVYTTLGVYKGERLGTVCDP